MQCFILAGGFATRLWPLTEHRAKPLLPLAGKPILSHLIASVPEELPITVSTNAAFGEDMQAWANNESRTNIRILTEKTSSDDEKLGALGAVRQWIESKQIDDDILLLTGDNYCGFSIDTFLAQAKEDTPLLAAFDIQDLSEATKFGTVILKEGTTQVEAFEEKPKEPKTTLVSTGCSIIPKSTIPLFVEYAKNNPDNVGGIFEEFLRKTISVECFVFTEPWFDIGSFDAYLDANALLVGKKCIQGEGTKVDACETDGAVTLGKNCSIEGGRLSNVILFDDCTVRDCVLEDCIIDENCALEGIDLRRQMLRKGTILKKPSN